MTKQQTNNSERFSTIFFILGIGCITTSIFIIGFGIFDLESINFYIVMSIISAIIGAVFFVLGANYVHNFSKQQKGENVNHE